MATVRNRQLTAKQKAFADYVAAGKTLSDSFRESYNTSNMKPTSIHEGACRLAANGKVIARIEARQQANERAITACSVSDRENVLTKLRAFAESATPADSMKIRATELLGKTVGLFKDVIETTVSRTSEEIQADLAKLLQQVDDSKDKGN